MSMQIKQVLHRGFFLLGIGVLAWGGLPSVQADPLEANRVVLLVDEAPPETVAFYRILRIGE